MGGEWEENGTWFRRGKFDGRRIGLDGGGGFGWEENGVNRLRRRKLDGTRMGIGGEGGSWIGGEWGLVEEEEVG